MHFYNTFNTLRFQDIIHTFVSFHVEKGGVFIGPNGFKIKAKKCHIPGFWGTSGTTVIIGWHYRLQIDTRWYHRSVWVVPLLDRALEIKL